jgi:threonine dehydrogenase-like Zn-dependent dehydrogenase
VRAVVLDADGLPGLAEVPDPAGPGALVRVLACGLCGSDVEKLGRGPAGAVLGHEIEGVLEDGTRVTVVHRVPCGDCDRCRAGYESACEEFRRLRIEPGGFAERLRATHVVPLDGIGPGDGIWVEPVACVLRGAERVPHGRVLVVGCGAIGQLWLQVLRRRGDDVVAVDLRSDRVAAAQALGARVDDEPVDAAVVTAHGGVNDALARVEPGGTVLVFAAPPEDVPVSVVAVYRRELHVVGSRSATPAHFSAAVAQLPELDLPEVTTLPLERFDEGVELYRRGDALKVVFTP